AVQVGAALTGIAPRHDGKGVRGDKGAGARDKEGAEILGEHPRTTREHRAEYYRAYARATVTYERRANRDAETMASFLTACGLDNERIAQREPAEASRNVSSFGATSLLAHIIPLSAVLRIALDAARDSCMAKGRAFYTSDLLIALLGMPGRRVEQC